MTFMARDPEPLTALDRFPVLPTGVSAVECGFPSPAQDYEHSSLDLNALLIRDPVSTFILTVSGYSMLDAGIAEGDKIIVDRGIEPAHGDVVLVAIDGGFSVKQLVSTAHKKALVPENSAYEELYLTDEMEIIIWGVVTTCLHRLHPRRLHR